MRVFRPLAALLGVVALAAGIGVLLAPGELADSGIGEAVAGTPVDAVAKYGLALAFGLLALFTGLSRTETGRRSLPTPETVGATRRTAGAVVDETLARVVEDGEGGKRARAEVRREVRAVAVETLAETDGVSAAAAERLIEAGEWTDDPRAAAFLGGADVPRPPLGLRLRDWLSADPSYAIRARAAVDAIDRRRADR